jgi:hypothetical protein
MALAKKNSIIAEFFGSAGALVNLINVFDAAVKTVQAKFHEQTAVGAQHAAPDRFSGGMSPSRSRSPTARPARKQSVPLSSFLLRRRAQSRF